MELPARDILERLLQGNRRFALGEALHPNVSVARRKEISSFQQPFAMILGCSDSRVPPELVFDCGLGDLFVMRTAGHTVDEIIIESILFGIVSLHIPVVMVLGHSGCGAVSRALQEGQHGARDGAASRISQQIWPAIEQCENRDNVLLDSVVKAHVKLTVTRIENLILPFSKDVSVLGAYYDLNTGIVEIISRPTRASA